MKKLLLLTTILCFSLFHSCSDKGEAFDGKWIAQDLEYEFELDCECTDEEKEVYKGYAEDGMSRNIKSIASSMELNLRPDYTADGILYDEVFHGTYKTNGDELTISIDDVEDIKFDIIKEGDQVLFVNDAPKDELAEMSDVTEDPNIGRLEVTTTKFKLILEEAP